MDAVWRQSFRAEMATGSGRHSAGVFWDLQEYYEHIDRKTMMNEARANQIPEYIIKPAMMAYSNDRILDFGGEISVVGQASKGLPAGCGLVTTFIQAFLKRSIDEYLLDIVKYSSQLLLTISPLQGFEAPRSCLGRCFFEAPCSCLGRCFSEVPGSGTRRSSKSKETPAPEEGASLPKQTNEAY